MGFIERTGNQFFIENFWPGVGRIIWLLFVHSFFISTARPQKQTGVWLGCCRTLNTGRMLPRVTGEFARR
jgi:hypothetical protein